MYDLVNQFFGPFFFLISIQFTFLGSTHSMTNPILITFIHAMLKVLGFSPFIKAIQTLFLDDLVCLPIDHCYFKSPWIFSLHKISLDSLLMLQCAHLLTKISQGNCAFSFHPTWFPLASSLYVMANKVVGYMHYNQVDRGLIKGIPFPDLI